VGSVPLAISWALVFSYPRFHTINIYRQVGLITTLVGTDSKKRPSWIVQSPIPAVRKAGEAGPRADGQNRSPGLPARADDLRATVTAPALCSRTVRYRRRQQPAPWLVRQNDRGDDITLSCVPVFYSCSSQPSTVPDHGTES